MNLNDDQKRQVAAWLNQGLKLAEVQKRLESDFGIRPTYMEVKLLVSELNVLPKDPPPPSAPKPVTPPPGGPQPSVPTTTPDPLKPVTADSPTPVPPGAGRVAVSVDQLTRPGAVVSGNVTFSDGNSASWYIDQSGRLALVAKTAGYRPPAEDVQQFQAILESELAKQGY